MRKLGCAAVGQRQSSFSLVHNIFNGKYYIPTIKRTANILEARDGYQGHLISLSKSVQSKRKFIAAQATSDAMTETKDTPQEIFRKDYAPVPYSFDKVNLEFKLNEDVTQVASTITISPKQTSSPSPDLFLDGRKDIKLVSVSIDDKTLAETDYVLTEKSLTIKGASLPSGTFTLSIVTHIKPQENTILEGLYKSGGNYCTQCEAMGFRGITYFYDRPDVMSKYTVYVEAAKDAYPVLLSNGNLIKQGDVGEGRHFAVWDDPFLKPCYLFALVAGDLAKKEDTFKTMSGKDVALRIFTQHHNASKVDWAMECLKRAMKWDEEAFGREYDLELFNIVAVDDFNMGAMENKSLNVFISNLVLALPETTTDASFVSIEGVIGHEYFHNWTGNRVTCRDWFQLTLKEGLTVYRDQEFTQSLHSRASHRISDAMLIRSAQFTEDSGAMSHPIRPDSYIKMDNFYTITVYEKGAEVIRMYRTLLGVDGFRKGMDLYFERHDGQAVTCDDFLAAMADANGADLSNLAKWYSQAGTPTVTVTTAYDAAAKTYTITAKQTTPPTAGQPDKIPVLIPLAVGLIDPQGAEIPLQLKGVSTAGDAPTSLVLRHENAEDTFVFENVPAKPVPSILRNLSAPVKLVVEGQSYEDLTHLLAHDTDPFNRWDAGQRLTKDLLIKLYNAVMAGGDVTGTPEQVKERAEAAGGVDERVVDAVRNVLTDTAVDGSFLALALTLPTQSELLNIIEHCDPVVIHHVRSFVRKSLASALKAELQDVVKRNSIDPSVPYSPQAEQVSKREAKNTALLYLATLEEPEFLQELKERYYSATNMTDTQGVLMCLASIDCLERNEVFNHFESKWIDDPLVMQKWMRIVCSSNMPGNLSIVKEILKHPKFSMTTPAFVYSVVGGFTSSPVNYHAADGSGYEFLSQFAMDVDKVNQIVSARVGNTFTSFRQLDKGRQAKIEGLIKGMVDKGGLTDNLFEILKKCTSV